MLAHTFTAGQAILKHACLPNEAKRALNKTVKTCETVFFIALQFLLRNDYIKCKIFYKFEIISCSMHVLMFYCNTSKAGFLTAANIQYKVTDQDGDGGEREREISGHVTTEKSRKW